MISLKSKISKLEQKHLSNSGYANQIVWCFEEPDNNSMSIECNGKTLFEGNMQEGKEFLKNIDRYGVCIMRLPSEARDWRK